MMSSRRRPNICGLLAVLSLLSLMTVWLCLDENILDKYGDDWTTQIVSKNPRSDDDDHGIDSDTLRNGPGVEFKRDSQEDSILAQAQSSWNRLHKSSASGERHAFETPLTTRQSVLERGFPLQWDACTMQNAFHRRHNSSRTLQVIVLGASNSAQTPPNCSLVLPDSYIYGRYSDLLDYSLQQDFDTIQVHNRAQGSTDSFLGAITLDGLVDPLAADVLIWEYGVNDKWGEPEDVQFQHSRYFLLWLTRVNILFQQAGRPPPPVIVVLLYERRIGKPDRYQRILDGGLESPWQATKTLLEQLQQRGGWNLQVLSLGSTIVNATAVLEDTSLLVNGLHHPSCQTAQLISNMLLHALLADLVHSHSCDTHSPPTIHSQHTKTTTAWNQWIDEMALLHDDEPSFRQLWHDLMNPQVRVGSWTPWPPRLGNHTNLRLDNWETIVNTPMVLTGKTDPSRIDRKLGYALADCTQERPLTFVLSEPDLVWLGLDIKGDPDLVQMTVDKKASVNLSDLISKAEVNSVKWIRLEVDRGSTSTSLSFCNRNATGGQAVLRQLVGVMVPPSPPPPPPP